MSTELKVGVLVVIAIVVFAFFVVRIEDRVWFEPETAYRVRAVFEDIAGLEPDSPVRLAGVRVGKVGNIDLTEDGRAEVTMQLDPGVRLRQDSVASVASLGLLGEKYLQLTSGSPEAEVVPDGGLIRGGRPVSIDQAVTVMNEIAADVQETTESLSNVFGTEAGENRMQRILENIEGFSSDLRGLVRTNRENLDATLTNVEDLTGALSASLPRMVSDIRTLVEDLSGLVASNEEKLGSASENLQRMTERLDRSAAELEEVIAKINRGDGTVAQVINEPETVNKLNAALDTVDDTLAAADTFFKRVGQAQFAFSLRSEFYEESESTKNYFGIRVGLGPRGDRAFIFEAVDDNVGRLDATTITTEVFGPGGELLDRQVQRRLIREEDFVFSALLAQRRGNWQLRGGLLESEAGGGIDYFAADDRWRFTFEAWDFGRDPDPHLKLRGQYQLFERLFVTAGWDDLLSDEFRQFFFGAGYSFR